MYELKVMILRGQTICLHHVATCPLHWTDGQYFFANAQIHPSLKIVEREHTGTVYVHEKWFYSSVAAQTMSQIDQPCYISSQLHQLGCPRALFQPETHVLAASARHLSQRKVNMRRGIPLKPPIEFYDVIITVTSHYLGKPSGDTQWVPRRLVPLAHRLVRGQCLSVFQLFRLLFWCVWCNRKMGNLGN